MVIFVNSVQRCFLKFFKLSTFYLSFDSLQMLNDNAFTLLSSNFYKAFLSIVKSKVGGVKKLLYVELLQHKTYCDNFLYLLQYSSTLLYTGHVFVDHLTICNIINCTS